MNEFAAYFMSEKPWLSIAIIAAGYVAWTKFEAFMSAGALGGAVSKSHKNEMRITLTLAKGLVAVLIGILVLQANGVNVPGLIASLGIVGVVVGFALQDVLKDLVMGADIVWDNFFSVGDVVRIGDCEGKVVDFNFKATKVRTLASNSVVTFCNRDVATVEVVSDQLDIDVPMCYDVQLGEARKTCQEIVRRCEKLEDVSSVEFMGTQDLGESEIDYRVRLHCTPAHRYDVRRAALAVVQDVFEERGLEFPFRRLDVNVLDN